MKLAFVVVLVFILVGCKSSQQSAPLTSEQATTYAVRLANDKAYTLFQYRPFVASQPAQLLAGHWLWIARQGSERGDIDVTVMIAADGSTNSVDLQYLNNHIEPTPRPF